MLDDIRQIFIVDDDESICRALKTLLMTYMFDVKTFNSARSFFESVSNDNAGCLILDIRMPEMDGWAMQKKLVDSGSKRPVIFISADHENDTVNRALRVGAVGFLEKPFSDQRLLDLIKLGARGNTLKADPI
jgi:FixJ family two-component response regulator